ncbi:MAG: TlpA family protein disulfide reductase [Gemmatimonadaceae bacterium]
MKRLLFALTLALSPLPLAAQELGLAVGSRAPAAVVESLDGKPVDLGAWIGKTPLLIEFWATWCPNCKELEPALVAAQRKYGGRVKFVGVAVSVNQSPELVRRYATKHALPVEVLFDRKGTATDAYDVPATSYVVVIDRAGKIVYTGQGGDQNLDAALGKAL